MHVASRRDQVAVVAAAGTSVWDVLIDAWRLAMSPYPAQDPVTLCDQPDVHGQRLGL
jgi:hypothetical protein